MATTTNFGWETPDDTDLVKDGAAAMRTLGNSIDASFVDLKGGTTGQVLSKNSNTDLDFTWVAQDDSNAIQNTIVDAKGDLIAASAADTPAKLAVGANGTWLVADSAQSTGLKWEGFVGVACYKSSTQSVPSATSTLITFDTENFDTNSFHSTSTNTSRITIPTGYAGKYLFTAKLSVSALQAGGSYRSLAFKKNGNFIAYAQNWSSSAGFPASNVDYETSLTQILDLAANDYIEMSYYQDSGVNATVASGISTTTFQAVYLGA